MPASSHVSSTDVDEDLSNLDPRLADARSALLRHDFVAALRLAGSARKQGADPSSVFALESTIFRSTDYLDKEIETLRRWTQAAPSDPRPWLKLFYIYLDLGWRVEADRASRQALAIAPTNSRSYVARAIYFYRSDSPELAIPLIKEARRLDPSNLNLADLEETILIKAHKFAEAEDDARKTLARTPEDMKVQMNLFHALLGQDKTREAEALARRIQQREPGNVEAAYELGGLAEKRGDVAEATRQFEKVASQDSGFGNVLWRLGRLYTQQGRIEEGRKLQTEFQTLERNTSDYETALSRLRTRDNSPDLHYQLAKYHKAADEIPQAIVELRRVLGLRPDDGKARSDLINALTEQGRLTEARQMNGPRAVRSDHRK